MRYDRLIRGLAGLLALAVLTAPSPAATAGDGDGEPFRVLHVMSYHADWQWNIDQFSAFKQALAGVPVEYRVFEMDTKRRGSEEEKRAAGAAARALIESWKPDLVYANDDSAQEYVTRHYVGSDLPFVFSAVNASPETYGFVGSPNVTGVLEHEHSVQTIRLLKQMVPNVKRIALIIDTGPTWPGVVERMKTRLADESDVEVVAVDLIKTFDQYKRTMQSYHGHVDAVGLLGVFNFADDAGDTVPFETVLRWTAENSKLPDFSFWDSRVALGTLCAMLVSGHEQGYTAGEMAKRILTDGQAPSQIPMTSTVKGEPILNLKRARMLDLKIPSSLLLNTRLIKRFSWDS